MPSHPATMSTVTTRGDGIDNLRESTVATPTPGETEILVRITARSLNYRDLLIINGVGGWKPDSDVVPISDAVGHVVATGTGVTRFHLGDRVMPNFLPFWREGELVAEFKQLPIGGPVNAGMLADYVIVDEQSAASAPESLSDEAAATLPIAGVTAWHALQRPRSSPADWVLIHGTGGVALLALQIAHARGLRTIITSSSDEKLSRVTGLGATATINYRDEDVAGRTREITGGRGADLVLETVGAANLNVSLDAVKVSGQISFIGVMEGLLDARITVAEFMSKNITLHGIETGSRQMLEELVAFIDQHGIVPQIDTVLPVAEAATGLKHLARSQHFGKIVLVS